MEFYKKGGTFVEGETSTDKKTILIVDDEQPIIDMLVYNLEKEGYNTLEATDGEKAVDIALNNTPDLILLDIMIPKMDGLSVCKRIRHTLNVPIIMLSAKGEEIDKILSDESNYKHFRIYKTTMNSKYLVYFTKQEGSFKLI